MCCEAAPTRSILLADNGTCSMTGVSVRARPRREGITRSRLRVRAHCFYLLRARMASTAAPASRARAKRGRAPGRAPCVLRRAR
jgi:hypothetical protein